MADSRASAELPRRRTCGDPQEKAEIWEERGGEQNAEKEKKQKGESSASDRNKNKYFFLKEQKQFLLFHLNF